MTPEQAERSRALIQQELAELRNRLALVESRQELQARYISLQRGKLDKVGRILSGLDQVPCPAPGQTRLVDCVA